MTKKPVSRAVLEERLKVIEDARDKHRLFAVKFGVYGALVFGVLATQAVLMADDLTATLQPVEIGQVVGSMLIAGALYNKVDSKPKDLDGKAKKGNVARVLRQAFYQGISWAVMLTAWW